MLKYLILVIENSLTTAILLSLLLAGVCNAADQRRNRPVAAGALAGVGASLVLAFVMHTTILINREFFNIGILSVAIIFGALFIAFNGGFLRKKAPRLRDAGLRFSAPALVAALLIYRLPVIFLYPSQFLLAGESIFSTDFLFKSIGYLAGLLVAFLTGLALFKTRGGMPEGLLRILTAVILLINIVDQFSTITQFLLARRIIPMSKGLFAFVKYTVNYDNYFLFLIIAVTLVLPILLWIRNLHPKGAWANPAQHRKSKATARGIRRRSALILACCVLSVLSLTAVRAYDQQEVTLSPAEPMNISGGRITIPIENLNDGHLHRFAYTGSENIEVRFIVIKKNESAWGVGLDACDICGATGYYERDDEVICKLCDVVMNKSTIGFKGGCNPVPLAYAIADGDMVVLTADLDAEQKRFK
jgi:uncharacterized membrane protein